MGDSRELLSHRILRKEYGRAVGTHCRPTRMHQAGFSLRYRRDGRAPTSLCLLRPDQALLSNFGPAGAAGARATPPHPPGPQDRLREYGPDGAAGSRRRAVGTAGPSQGLRADREQRTPPSTPPGPQYFRGTTGRTDPPDDCAGLGVHRGKRPNRPRDLPGAGRRVSPMLGIFEPSFYTPIDRQGSARAG